MEIFVEDLRFVGHHGVHEDERREGRQFRADLRVVIDRRTQRGADAIESTVDYRRLAEIVVEVGEGRSYKLIERLAEQMLDTVFERFPRVERAELTLRKYTRGVPGAPESVGVRRSCDRDSIAKCEGEPPRH
ncbi:MAG: dihydroneopterin aldolase [Bradymonadaceae bacterium]